MSLLTVTFLILCISPSPCNCPTCCVLSLLRINAFPCTHLYFPGLLHWQVLRGKSSAGKNRALCNSANLHQLRIGHLCSILKYPSLRSSLLLNEENVPSHLFLISKHHECGCLGFFFRPGFFLIEAALCNMDDNTCWWKSIWNTYFISS